MNRGELPDRFYIQKSQTRKLSVALMELTKELTLAKAFKHREILNVWREIVGEDIHKHTQVTGIRKDCLVVEVDSPPRLHHLTNFCKEDILKELQTKYRNTFITSIKFKQSAGTD